MNDKFFNEENPEIEQNADFDGEKEVSVQDDFDSSVVKDILSSKADGEADEKQVKENISTAFNLQDYPTAPQMPEIPENLFSQPEALSEAEVPETPGVQVNTQADEVSEIVQPEAEAIQQLNSEAEAPAPVGYEAAEAPVQQTPVFNPYAPKMQQSDFMQNQVTPGYTNVNTGTAAQPNYNYQQNQPYGQYSQQNPNYPGYNPGQPTGNFPEEPEKSKGKLIGIIVLAVCLIIAVVGIVAGLLGSGDDNSDAVTETTPQSTVQQYIPSTTESENIVVSTTQPVTEIANSVFVADKVRPSVVGVMTYVNGKLSGEGSGVLMSEKDGWTYVVTCAHVISESGVTYGILLLDGTTIEAELVAYDERTDIGVVKVNRTGLPLAEFGDSSSLKIGEPVYAVGNPGGSEFFGSITNGIVSSIDRSISSTYTMTCIQHNAAINPGNSGGALVNSAGQVIGINSSKIASTDYEGMGFAVPTSIATPIVDALIEFGYVPNRPKLGIQYAPVSAYQLYSLVVSIKGLPQGSLVIAGISEDSSFANTEVEVGDLIIAVNGKDMTDSSVLLDMVETGSVGDTLTLTLCRIESRTYKTSTFDVTISLVEDKGSTTKPTEATTNYQDGYYYGGSDSFDDFFNDFFGW